MKKKTEKIVMIIGGALVGVLNGFFGGGGGMLCVPLLEKLLHLETKKAHATAILIILPITIASVIIYILGKFAGVQETLIVSAGVSSGGIAGALLLKKLNSKIIALIFALIMIAAGIKLTFF